MVEWGFIRRSWRRSPRCTQTSSGRLADLYLDLDLEEETRNLTHDLRTRSCVFKDCIYMYSIRIGVVVVMACRVDWRTAKGALKYSTSIDYTYTYGF